MKILIVDDCEAHRELVAIIARGVFDHVDIMMASNGASALDIAGDFMPKLIITDMNMAGSGGRTLLYNIKKSRSTAHIPVVIMSGAMRPLDVKMCYQTGACAVFSKDRMLENVRAICEFWKRAEPPI